MEHGLLFCRVRGKCVPCGLLSLFLDLKLPSLSLTLVTARFDFALLYRNID